jgi:hypothetical protein
MKLMIALRYKHGLTEAEQERITKLWQTWSPPPGVEILAHYVTPEAKAFIVVETTSATAIFEMNSVWFPFCEYKDSTRLISPMMEKKRLTSSRPR